MDPAINPFWAAVNIQTRYRCIIYYIYGKIRGNYVILKLFSA